MFNTSIPRVTDAFHLMRRQDFLLPCTELSKQYTHWSTQSATIDGINVEGSKINMFAVAVQLDESKLCLQLVEHVLVSIHASFAYAHPHWLHLALLGHVSAL